MYKMYKVSIITRKFNAAYAFIKIEFKLQQLKSLQVNLNRSMDID